jgi:hypothetical protein
MSSAPVARLASSKRPTHSMLTAVFLLPALSAVCVYALAQQPGVIVTQQGKITNLETKDNLKSFHHLDCVDLAALTTDDTPADIYPAVRTCIDHGEFQRAARLFAVAGAYGRFDTLRVLDSSAHQAIPVLGMTNLSDLSQDAKEQFRAAFKAIISSDRLAELCGQARKLGPPTYYPTYMTQHGMSAFTGKGGGLKEDLNVAEAWDSSLSTYLHCPPSSK